MSRRTIFLTLAGVVTAGILVRLYHLGLRSIWFDEAFTWRLIQFPWGQMFHRAALDVHPPLYYVFAKSWAGVFGASIVSLRSLSVLLAGCTAASAYLFTAYAWGQRRVGLLAATLVAFSAWQITFAWEARMYVLGTCLALLSAYCLLQAVRQKQQRFGWWLLYGLTAGLFAYTHYYAFFSLAAQAVWFLGIMFFETRGRVGEIIQSRRFWLGIGGVAVAVAMYIPWLPIFFQQNQQVQNSFWIPPLQHWSLAETVYKMFLPTSLGLSHSGWGAVVTLLPLTVILLVLLLLVVTPGLRQPERKNTTADAAWLVALSAVMPFALSILVSLTGRSLYQDRYFVFAHVFLLLAVAVVVGRIPWPKARTGITAFVVVLFFAAHVHYWQELDIFHHPGVQGAAQLVYSQKTDNEVVVVGSSFIYFPVYHYAQEDWHAGEPFLYDPSGELSHFSGGPILEKTDVVGPDVFTNPDTKSMWVVDTDGFGSSLTPVPTTWQVVSEKSFQEVFGYQGKIIVRHLKR